MPHDLEWSFPPPPHTAQPTQFFVVIFLVFGTGNDSSIHEMLVHKVVDVKPLVPLFTRSMPIV